MEAHWGCFLFFGVISNSGLHIIFTSFKYLAGFHGMDLSIWVKDLHLETWIYAYNKNENKMLLQPQASSS